MADIGATEMGDIIGMRVGIGSADKSEAARGLPLSVEQQGILERVADLMSKNNAHEALETAANPFKYKHEYKSKLASIALTGRDDAGNRVDSARALDPKATKTPQADNLDFASKKIDLYTKLCRQGLISLAPAEQTVFITRIADCIRGDSVLLKIFGDPAANTVDVAMMKEIIDSRHFKNILVDKLNEVMGDEALQNVDKLEKALADATEAVLKKEAEIADKKAEKKAIKDRKSKAAGKIADFEDEVDASTHKTNKEKLDDLRRDPDVKMAIAARENVIAAKDRLEEARAGLQNETNDYLVRERLNIVRSAQQEYNTSRQAVYADPAKLIKFAEYEMLAGKQDELHREQKEAEADLGRIGTIDSEIKKLEIESRKLKAAEADARRAREDVSDYLPARIDDLFTDAAQKYIQEKGSEGRRKAEGMVTEETKKVKDKKEKELGEEKERVKEVIAKAIKGKYKDYVDVPNPDRRWYRRGVDKTIQVFQADPDKIDTGRRIMFSYAEGPDKVVRDMLLMQLCPLANDGTNCSDDEEQKIFMSLAGDKAYMKETGMKLMGTLLTNMKEAGIKPTNEEMNYLTEGEMGEAIDHVLATNSQSKELIEKLKKADVLPKDFKEKGAAKRLMEKFGPGMLLTIVLSALGIAGVSFGPSLLQALSSFSQR